MGNEQVLVEWKALRAFTKDAFAKVGMPPEDAAIEADVLIWANLRGVDSHGVQRIPGYISAAKSGRYNVSPNVRVEKETAATLLVEADHAFGPVVTVFAMNKAIEKARAAGIGWCLIRNTTHQGAMGYYALMAANAGMAGIAFVCNPPNMVIYGAKAPGVHNSPIAIAVPGKAHSPLILDIATSVAARGKIDLAAEKGIAIPEGWALDKDGNPTTDPNQAAMVLPFGDYKGSGLALMFACLASQMAGNPLITPKLRNSAVQPPLGTQNSVVAAIDIATFTDLDAYQSNIDDLIAAEKDLPRADGIDEIYVPGEIEERVLAQRKASGIPLPAATYEKLGEVARDLGIDGPPALA